MSERYHKVHPAVIAALAIGVVALALGSTVIVSRVTGGGADRNGSYGAISCNAPALPGSAVHVTESDMGHVGEMMAWGNVMGVSLRSDPSSVPSGTVSFVVTNQGNLVHELVVMPVTSDGPGTRPVGSDGKIDESESLGEASRSCRAGAGDGLAPGSTGWVTLHLRPGTYELICNEPWHYASGMFDTLTVT